ncbi:uncharacterized protein RSE6_10792 [Rhynchosporium secalis]|uniref:Uncharacterized protein n=1 Tax=Rhynchosporium secalis TaxID=38038 RepID=A0A1E1MLE2_RHYSE|nr:uncharacterized protein RSE6_10792 [Rhynchosporium secalis]
MFCTSLRKRPEWASVPTTLLSSQTLRWEEKSLKTYDIAIALPQSRHDSTLTLFHLLALSPSDLQDQALSMARIQHLYHHSGGQNVGIIFLLNEKSSKVNGTIAMMNLQVSLFSILEMPIIPLFSLSSLETALSAFQRQLAETRLSTMPAPVNPAVSLLPYCTNSPPLAEHARNVVSDICQDLSGVSHLATSVDGQSCLRNYLDEAVPGSAQAIIDFWADEIIIY